jgi:hypothetical protein
MLAKLIPWDRFLRSLKVKKFGLWLTVSSTNVERFGYLPEVPAMPASQNGAHHFIPKQGGTVLADVGINNM